MSVSTKKRRRWPWILLASVLLLVAVPIAWQFRPLSATERALVGRWKSVDGVSAFDLSANRRFHWKSVDDQFVHELSATHRSQPLLFHLVDSRFLEMEGFWSATSSSLSFRDDVDGDNFFFLPWLKRVRAYAVATFSSTAEVRRAAPTASSYAVKNLSAFRNSKTSRPLNGGWSRCEAPVNSERAADRARATLMEITDLRW